MRFTTRASNGPNHLGFCTRQLPLGPVGLLDEGQHIVCADVLVADLGAVDGVKPIFGGRTGKAVLCAVLKAVILCLFRTRAGASRTGPRSHARGA